jgi:cytochrome c oxidase subunit 2
LVHPTRTGTYDVFCEQLCGVAHFAMRAKVVVEGGRVQGVVRGLPDVRSVKAEVPGNATAGQPLYAVCASCHGAQGEGNPALNAPKLSGQDGWYLVRQLRSFKSGARGTNDKEVFGKVMAPMAATLPDDAAIKNVVAYIKTRPDTPAPTTGKGNAKAGHASTFGACHGAKGQGVQATNALRLKGMSDWYMVTQLKNFKQGIRGTHPKDLYGPQMNFMAGIRRMTGKPMTWSPTSIACGERLRDPDVTD